MRRFLLILMITVLPVRGWAVDVMAVSMAAQQLLVVESVAVDAAAPKTPGESGLQASPPMSADCPMMSMLAGERAPDSQGQAGSPISKICATCQLCMGVVTSFTQPHAPLAPLPPTALLSGRVSFSSAERASGFKPPIS